MRMLLPSLLGLVAAGYILEAQNDPHAESLSYYERVLRWFRLSVSQSRNDEKQTPSHTLISHENGALEASVASASKDPSLQMRPSDRLSALSATLLDKPPRVVLLIHGFLGVRGTMYPLAYTLEKQTENWTYVVPMSLTNEDANPYNTASDAQKQDEATTSSDAAELVEHGRYEPAKHVAPRIKRLWIDEIKALSPMMDTKQSQKPNEIDALKAETLVADVQSDAPYFASVINWAWPSRNKSLEDHAESLVLHLQSIVACRPDTQFAFVVHSCGASILRASLSHPNCPQNAKDAVAVLLAPCNRGSAFARRLNTSLPFLRSVSQFLVGGKTGKQLMENEPEFFESLGAFPKGTELYMMRCGGRRINPYLNEENDGILTTSDMELTPKIVQTDKIKIDIVPLDHLLILYSPAVINNTIRFIRDAFYRRDSTES
eukprot:TRINITY_DN2044_c0_g2_i1.p1 TRINITY_DN2044_c0_g2~~TRINITY_DN2044_c0_g2_i1.p1  ORF type:complete len:432 (-),score=83.87 TRINITY_DN2044_c0_g2_i1:254-1549(-)